MNNIIIFLTNLYYEIIQSETRIFKSSSVSFTFTEDTICDICKKLAINRHLSTQVQNKDGKLVTRIIHADCDDSTVKGNFGFGMIRSDTSLCQKDHKYWGI